MNPAMVQKLAAAALAAKKTANENPRMMAAAKQAAAQTAAQVAAGKPVKEAMAGAAASQMGANQAPAPVPAMSKGGIIRKGGRYYLHKGEKVVSKRSVPKVTKAMQKAGMTLRHKGRAAVKKVPFIPMNKIRNMANGGTVLKTGLHILKPGQRIIPASKATKAKVAIKKYS